MYLKADWRSTLTLARLADEMEFEALVPVGRWKGFGGVTNFNGAGFEPYTWAAAIGAVTKYSAVFATSHVPTVHPIMAAKQATTIDHVTGGRFALNIVTGWFLPEIEMFGAPQMDHDLRYDCAIEWLDIIKRLWTEDEEFDYSGKYYRIKKGILRPKPIQAPYPVVMNAGGSETGRHYAAKYCDVAFVIFDPDDVGRRQIPGQQLPGTCTPGIRPRSAAMDRGVRGPGRDRKGGPGFLRLLCPSKGRLGRGDQPGRNDGYQREDFAA